MRIGNTLGFILGHPLNRNHPVKAIQRFLAWQIGSRLLPGAVVFNWINDAKVIVRRGDSGITGSIYCGLQEFEEMSYVLHTITSNDLFVDVGANIGAYTILACAVKGARGFCFEPIPDTYARLRANLRLNDLDERVISLNMGVSDKEGVLLFTSDQDTINHVATQDEKHKGNVVRVDVKTLDSILREETPSIIKIDVEGFETPVLQGAVKTLAQPSLHSIIIELNGSGARYGFDELNITRLLEAAGFQAYHYRPVERRLVALESLSQLHPGNVIFVRDAESIQQRLHRAPRLSINGHDI
jgi:FkbM family methyltransferase